MPVSPDQGIRARLIRTLGFTHKELLSALQQPRLVLILVVAPFLILLVFGLGYRETFPPFRTLLVLSNEQGDLAAAQEELREAFTESISLEGVTTDRPAATRRLRSGDVDLLIIAPEDPLASLDRNEKAEFSVVHNEVDPVMRASIALVARLSVEELNRRVVAEVVDVAQERSEEAEEPLAAMREEASALVADLESGDDTAARNRMSSLQESLAALSDRRSPPGDVYSSVGAALGAGGVGAIAALAEQLDEGDEPTVEEAREMEATLADLDTSLERARDLEPQLLVSPFGVEVTQLTGLPPAPAVFYAPGTIVLLIQHLALTLAAMSFVRERELGLTEVYRVSPLSPAEVLGGKYLGFLTVCGVVAVALTAAMTLLGVPFGWSISQYAIVVAMVTLASIGLGFIIGGISQTDSQAVQYTMITLLVSIFFTGYVLPLERLAEPVQAISYLIPARYGIVGLQEVLLRRTDVDATFLAGLATYTVALGIAAWWATRRQSHTAYEGASG